MEEDTIKYTTGLMVVRALLKFLVLFFALSLGAALADAGPSSITTYSFSSLENLIESTPSGSAVDKSFSGTGPESVIRNLNQILSNSAKMGAQRSKFDFSSIDNQFLLSELLGKYNDIIAPGDMQFTLGWPVQGFDFDAALGGMDSNINPGQNYYGTMICDYSSDQTTCSFGASSS
ncbi:MAG: hypothetical protein A4E44_01337 [Methanosaeta sp. PtaB.Bin018]|jgi:hypothetical protein|nr:hypothetical protein [Methanothrix sp.]OPX75476.1 MAG: hypothetical protein A4E44_01337 [Methanosaeta sp. PtaB.Bin018]OPY47949.1 MAG: hypothetical protein A4E46_00184 [Methanosaeta sp. PtaU1.Bin016]